MERVIFFILKFCELVGLTYLPYLIGSKFFEYNNDPQPFIIDWVAGVLGILFTGCVLSLLIIIVWIAIPELIAINKEWAAIIYNKIK